MEDAMKITSKIERMVAIVDENMTTLEALN